MRSDSLKKDIIFGLITGGILGIAMSRYVTLQNSPRKQKRILKRNRKINNAKTRLLGCIH